MTCPECRQLVDGWLDYREPYRGWIQQGSTRSSVEGYHIKAQERRQLVRQQLQLIEESCKTHHDPH